MSDAEAVLRHSHDLLLGWKGHRGWVVQQALKLASARAVTAPMVLAAIEAQVGPVELFFLKRRSAANEFFLIHAAAEHFIALREALFAEGLFASGTIFRSTPATEVDRLLDRAEAGAETMLGVHRARIRGLPARLEAVWHKAGLLRAGEAQCDILPTVRDGSSFITVRQRGRSARRLGILLRNWTGVRSEGL